MELKDFCPPPLENCMLASPGNIKKMYENAQDAKCPSFSKNYKIIIIIMVFINFSFVLCVWSRLLSSLVHEPPVHHLLHINSSCLTSVLSKKNRLPQICKVVTQFTLFFNILSTYYFSINFGPKWMMTTLFSI